MKNKIFSCFDNLNTYIIAEAGLNHNGSIEIAKKLIDLASEAGCNAVKFQKRTVSNLAIGETLNAADNRFPEFGNTYRQIREHLEFNMDEYILLKEYAEKRSLDFLCTAFDIEAADFLNKLGVSLFKLASHSMTNLELLEYMARTGKQSILSTGMSDLSEIETAVNIFKKYETPLLLMHCVSAYPTPLDECNLNLIYSLKEKFGLPVGYSGHELGYLPTLTAVSMGAVCIERHFTLDNNMIGFDHKMSLGPNELISMVRDIRTIKKIKGTGEKEISSKELITRQKYHVSMVSKNDIKIGEVLTGDLIVYRNPGTGIPAKDAPKLIGKIAQVNIPRDVLLSFDMFK